GAVIEDAAGQRRVRDPAIDRGEIGGGLPFRGGHRRRWIGCGFGMDVHGEAPCLYTEDTHGVRGVSLPCDMVTKLATAFQRTRWVRIAQQNSAHSRESGNPGQKS